MHVPVIHDQASGLTVSFGQNQRYLDLKEVNGSISWITKALPGTYWMEISNPTEKRLEVVASVDGRDVRRGSEPTTESRGVVLPELSSWRCSGWLNSGSLTRLCTAPGTPTDILVTIYTEDPGAAESPRKNPEQLPTDRPPRANERFGVTKFVRSEQTFIRARLVSSPEKRTARRS